MCPVLTRFGHLDVAYELMMRREYPGWLYPVTQGATTIWERWNGWTPERGFADPEMNSFNHYAFGAVAQWLHETVGGIAPDAARPGYRNVVIAPRPGGGLTSSRCSLETSRDRRPDHALG
jgi:alpha-L-rhamnosidase